MQNTNFICYFCLLLPRISCLNYFLNEGKRLQDVGLGTSSNRQSDAQKTFILLSTQSEHNPKIREKIESLQTIVYKPCFSIQLLHFFLCNKVALPQLVNLSTAEKGGPQILTQLKSTPKTYMSQDVSDQSVLEDSTSLKVTKTHTSCILCKQRVIHKQKVTCPHPCNRLFYLRLCVLGSSTNLTMF